MGFFDRIFSTMRGKTGTALSTSLSDNAPVLDSSRQNLSVKEQTARLAKEADALFDRIAKEADLRSGLAAEDSRGVAKAVQREIDLINNDRFNKAYRDDLRIWHRQMYIASRMEGQPFPPSLAYTDRLSHWFQSAGIPATELISGLRGPALTRAIQELSRMGAKWETRIGDGTALANFVKDSNIKGVGPLLAQGAYPALLLPRSFFELPSSDDRKPEEQISLLRASYEKGDFNTFRLLVLAGTPDTLSQISSEAVASLLIKDYKRAYLSAVKKAQEEGLGVITPTDKMGQTLSAIALMASNGYFKNTERRRELYEMLLLLDPRFGSGNVNKTHEDQNAIKEMTALVGGERAEKLIEDNTTLSQYENRPPLDILWDLVKSEPERKNTMAVPDAKKESYFTDPEKAISFKKHLDRQAEAADLRKQNFTLGANDVSMYLISGIHKLNDEKWNREMVQMLQKAPDLANLPIAIYAEGKEFSLINEKIITEPRHREALMRGDTVAAAFYRDGPAELYRRCCTTGKVDFEYENLNGESILGQMARAGDLHQLTAAHQTYDANINYHDSLGRGLIDIALEERRLLLMEILNNPQDLPRVKTAALKIKKLMIFCNGLIAKEDYRRKTADRYAVYAEQEAYPLPAFAASLISDDDDFDLSFAKRESSTHETAHEWNKDGFYLPVKPMVLPYRDESVPEYKTVREAIDGVPLKLGEDAASNRWLLSVYRMLHDKNIPDTERNEKQSTFINLLSTRLIEENRGEDLSRVCTALLTPLSGYRDPCETVFAGYLVGTVAKKASMNLRDLDKKSRDAILGLYEEISSVLYEKIQSVPDPSVKANLINLHNETLRQGHQLSEKVASILSENPDDRYGQAGDSVYRRQG